ncbi:hypothetical protein FRC03_006126, partial [Tulasnella sp. 419]
MATSPTETSFRNRIAGFSLRNAFKRHSSPAQPKQPPRQSGGSSNYSQVLSANSPAPPTRTNSSKLTEEQPPSARTDTDMFEGRIPPQYIIPPHPEPVITPSRGRSNSGNSIGGLSNRTIRIKLNSKKPDRLSEALEEDDATPKQAIAVTTTVTTDAISSSPAPLASQEELDAPLEPPRPIQDQRNSIPASYYSDELQGSDADPFASYTPARRRKPTVEFPAGTADSTKPHNTTFDPRSSTYNFIHSTIKFNPVDVPEPTFTNFLDMTSSPNTPSPSPDTPKPKLEHMSSIRSAKSATSSDTRSVTQRTRSALSRLSIRRNKAKKQRQGTDGESVEWDLSPVGTMRSQMEATKEATKKSVQHPEPFPEEEYKGWQTPPLRAVVVGQLAIAPPDSDYDQIKPFPAPPRSNPSPTPRSTESPVPPPLRQKISASSFRSLGKHAPLASRRVYSHQVTGSESSIFFPVATAAIPNRSGKHNAHQPAASSPVSETSVTIQTPIPEPASPPLSAQLPKAEPAMKMPEPVVESKIPHVDRSEKALSAIRESLAIDSNEISETSGVPINPPLALPTMPSNIQGQTGSQALFHQKIDQVRPLPSLSSIRDSVIRDSQSQKALNTANAEREVIAIETPKPAPRAVEGKRNSDRDSFQNDSDELNDVYLSGDQSDGLTSPPQSARSSWWKFPEDSSNLNSFKFPAKEGSKRERPNLTITPPDRGSAPSPSPSNFSSLTTPGALLSALSGLDDDIDGPSNDSGMEDHPLFFQLESPTVAIHPRATSSRGREAHRSRARSRSTGSQPATHTPASSTPKQEARHGSLPRSGLTMIRDAPPSQPQASASNVQPVLHTPPQVASTDKDESPIPQPSVNLTDVPEVLHAPKPQAPRKPLSLSSRSSSPAINSKTESLESRPGTPHSTKLSLSTPSTPDRHPSAEIGSVPPVPPLPAHVQAKPKGSPLQRPRSRSRGSRVPIHSPTPQNMPSISSLSSIALGLSQKPSTPSPAPAPTVSAIPTAPGPSSINAPFPPASSAVPAPSVSPAPSAVPASSLPPAPSPAPVSSLPPVPSTTPASSTPPALVAVSTSSTPPVPTPVPAATPAPSTVPTKSAVSVPSAASTSPAGPSSSIVPASTSVTDFTKPVKSIKVTSVNPFAPSPGLAPLAGEVRNPRPEDDMKARKIRNASPIPSKQSAASAVPSTVDPLTRSTGSIKLHGEVLNPRPEDDMRARRARSGSASLSKQLSTSAASSKVDLHQGTGPMKFDGEVLNPRPEDDMRARRARSGSTSLSKQPSISAASSTIDLLNQSTGSMKLDGEVLNPRPEDDMRARRARSGSTSLSKQPSISAASSTVDLLNQSTGSMKFDGEVLNPRPEDDMRARRARSGSTSLSKQPSTSAASSVVDLLNQSPGAVELDSELVDPRPEDDMRTRRSRNSSFSSTISRRDSGRKNPGQIGLNPSAPAWPIRPSLLEAAAAFSPELGPLKGKRLKTGFKVPKMAADLEASSQLSDSGSVSGKPTSGSWQALRQQKHQEDLSDSSNNQSQEHLVVEMVSEGNPGYVSPHFYTRALPSPGGASSSGMSTSSYDQGKQSSDALNVARQQSTVTEPEPEAVSANDSPFVLVRTTSPPPEYRPPSPEQPSTSSAPNNGTSDAIEAGPESSVKISLAPVHRSTPNRPGLPETDSSPVRKTREPKLIPVLVERDLDPPTPVFVAVSRPRPAFKATASNDSATRQTVSSRSGTFSHANI